MQKSIINRKDEMDFRSAEAYKSLRTNIQFSGDQVKVIALTSCLPDEGKSSVAMNLALSFADADKKVLLIDADMRKSVLVGRYRIQNADFGLSHYLSGQCEWDQVLYQTNAERLHMILSGPIPPNPSELLQGDRFKKLIKDLRNVYDYIIIDCPPIGAVSDAVIVGNYSDGVALVMAAEKISFRFAQKMKKQLQNGNCKILGVILNKVPLKGKHSYGRYYGKYYGKDYYKK